MKKHLLLLGIVFGIGCSYGQKINRYDTVYRIIIPKGNWEYVQIHKGDLYIRISKNTTINYAHIVDIDEGDTTTKIDTIEGQIKVFPHKLMPKLKRKQVIAPQI